MVLAVLRVHVNFPFAGADRDLDAGQLSFAAFCISLCSEPVVPSATLGVIDDRVDDQS